MSASLIEKKKMSARIWNVPNALSLARLFLALVVFGLIEFNAYLPALICFSIAVGTDWVDGWYARKYQQITKLGRILDPFVDKVIIIGTMIALCTKAGSGLASWMVTVVTARELLVTSLRGLVEGAGGDFSAKQLGKWKMVLQCAAIIAIFISLFYAQVPLWLIWARAICIWGAVLLTILSGIEYVVLVVKALKTPVEVGA